MPRCVFSVTRGALCCRALNKIRLHFDPYTSDKRVYLIRRNGRSIGVIYSKLIIDKMSCAMIMRVYRSLMPGGDCGAQYPFATGDNVIK